MLQRKITDFLIRWKSEKDSECLVIKGARQVGKTYIVEKFGRDYYDSFFELNFIFHPELIKVFDESLEVDDITRRMSAHFPGRDTKMPQCKNRIENLCSGQPV